MEEKVKCDFIYSLWFVGDLNSSSALLYFFLFSGDSDLLPPKTDLALKVPDCLKSPMCLVRHQLLSRKNIANYVKGFFFTQTLLKSAGQ